MSLYHDAGDVLVYHGGAGRLQSAWPFQPYPWFVDFEHEKVICHPAASHIANVVRQGTDVLIVGKPSSGKTLTARKVAFDLLSSFSIRFYESASIYDRDGSLSTGFIQSLQQWLKLKLPMLAVIEDVHHPNYHFADFLQQVQAYPVTWIFTSRRPLPFIDGETTRLKLDRTWLLSVIDKQSMLLEERGFPRLPSSVVDDLFAFGDPDLRALHYVIESLRTKVQRDADARTLILRYLHERYLSVPSALPLLRLCAIAQFEVGCDASFIQHLPDELMASALVIRTSGHNTVSVLSIDAEFARWCLRTLDTFGVHGIGTKVAEKFVRDSVIEYVSGWYANCSEVVDQIASDDPQLAAQLITSEQAFKQLQDHVRTFSPATFVRLLELADKEGREGILKAAGVKSAAELLTQSDGFAFARTMYRLAQFGAGRDVIGNIDADTITRKLNRAGDLRICATSFVALSVSNDIARLKEIAAQVDYSTAISLLSDLTPLERLLTLLKRHDCDKALIQAAVRTPIQHLAVLARKSKRLRAIGLVFSYLSSSRSWDGVAFARACGDLATQFNSSSVSAIAHFIFLIRQRVVQSQSKPLFDAWALFSNYAIASGIAAKLRTPDEVEHLCAALDPDSREALLRDLLERHRTLAEKIVNNASMGVTARMAEQLCTFDVSCSWAAGPIFELVKRETWNSWLDVNNNGWPAILTDIPLLLTLRSAHGCTAIPEAELVSKLSEFAQSDLALRRNVATELTLTRFADLVKVFAENQLGDSVLETCDDAAVHGWTTPTGTGQGKKESALRVIFGLGKLVATFHTQNRPIPGWLIAAVETFPYDSLPIEQRTARGLNKLIFHMQSAGLDPRPVSNHLRRFIHAQSSILKGRGIMRDWLWDMIIVDGVEVAGRWLEMYFNRYLDVLRHADIVDEIFLLWNGWTVSEAYAAQAVKDGAVRSRLRYMLRAKTVSGRGTEQWQRCALAVIADMCGYSELREIWLSTYAPEMVWIPSPNPAIDVLLAVAHYEWVERGDWPVDIVESLLAASGPVRDKVSKLLGNSGRAHASA